MNFALIFAGGVGTRMNSPLVPKQFIKVCNVPIIIHTLRHFQEHKDIDGIVVVCLESYIDVMKSYAKEFNLTKIKKIVKGGNTGQESIFHGLCAIKELAQDDDIVLIHDAVRPIIDADLISANIQCVKNHGNSISVSSATETMCLTEMNSDSNIIKEVLPRTQCFIGRAPQSFRVKDIYDAHVKANNEHYTEAIDSASLLKRYGYELHYVKCSHFNIKLTTPMDLELYINYYKKFIEK